MENSIVSPSESQTASTESQIAPDARVATDTRQSPVSRFTPTAAYKAIMGSPIVAGTILGMSRTRFFTILLIVLLVGFAAVKLRPYIAYLSSMIGMIRTLFDSTVNLAASATKGVVDNAADGTEVIVDKLSGTSAPKKAKTSPEPDDTTSSVQSKSGYCYVGDWKGVRSCVQVNGDCPSGKVFPTKQECAA